MSIVTVYENSPKQQSLQQSSSKNQSYNNITVKVSIQTNFAGERDVAMFLPSTDVAGNRDVAMSIPSTDLAGERDVAMSMSSTDFSVERDVAVSIPSQEE